MAIMGGYLPLFSIEVTHRFFDDDAAPSLEFVPTAACARLLANTGLIKREMSNGVRLFYDEERADSLLAHVAAAAKPCALGFKVYARDVYFMNYTRPLPYRNDAILYFDNRTAHTVDIGQRLHGGEHVSDDDFLPLDDDRVHTLLDRKALMVRPVFLVDIELGAIGLDFRRPGAVINRRYLLRFDTRRTFWKYCLVGDLAHRNVFISDLANQLEFAALGEETLSDRRTAIVFRSTAAIPLTQRFDHRFQLREQGPGGGRVLIRRLPVATASHINKEMIDGKEQIVSEIYVNC